MYTKIKVSENSYFDIFYTVAHEVKQLLLDMNIIIRKFIRKQELFRQFTKCSPPSKFAKKTNIMVFQKQCKKDRILIDTDKMIQLILINNITLLY